MRRRRRLTERRSSRVDEIPGASGEPAACHYAAMASATAPRTPCWQRKHMISVEPRSTIVQCGREGPDRQIYFSRGCDA